jgi:caa(3)-type oxidase subunit IV
VTQMRSVNLTWVALMAATITTTWVLTHDLGGVHVATVATMAIASWKVRLIVLDFMELRHAPLVGRLVFELWSVGAAVMILAFYLATPGAT